MIFDNLKEQIAIELCGKYSKRNITLNHDLFADYSFAIDDKRSCLFLKKPLKKIDIKSLLDSITVMHDKEYWQSYIILGETEESFVKNELTYFNNVNAFVRLYLIDVNTKKQYVDNSWTFLDMAVSKIIKKVSKIIN